MSGLLIISGVVPFVTFGVVIFWELRLHGLLPGMNKKASSAAVAPATEDAAPHLGKSMTSPSVIAKGKL